MNTGISTGKIKMPHNVLIYGTKGIGKSSFGADAPSPVFLGPESGSNNLDVARFENVQSFADVRKNIAWLTNDNDHKYKTLVVDSIDWMEPLLHQEICKEQGKEAIESCFGDYGKWVGGVNGRWMQFFQELNQLRTKKKMNMVYIAHEQVKKFDDPNSLLPYERYQLKLLNKSASALWAEYVDVMLFANYEVLTKQVNKTDKKSKAFGEGKRLMWSQQRPAFDAKNRFGLPFEMPLGWSYYESAMSTGPSLENVMQGLNEQMADPKLAPYLDRIKTAIEKANGNIEQLLKIGNYATTLTTAGE